MKISNPRGFGFSNPLFSNEKTLDNAMMSDTIKVPIVIVAKESEGFACAKSLLSSPALLAHASIAPVTVFFLAESTSRLPITVDEIERWKRGGVKIITSVNEDPDGIVDYHSLTIRWRFRLLPLGTRTLRIPAARFLEPISSAKRVCNITSASCV
jgi:hypothetical protein